MFKVLILALILPALSWAQKEVNDPYRSLSVQDYNIYVKTLHSCAQGNLSSALKTSLNPEIIKSASINVLKIAMFDIQASRNRMQSRMLSPETYKLRNSDGFWMALATCYGHRSYGGQAFIKNLIDFGHLSSEVIGTVGSVYAAAELIVASNTFIKSYPFLSRFMAFAAVNLAVFDLYRTLKKEFIDPPTKEEQEAYKQLEKNLFSDVNESIQQVKELAHFRIQQIDAKLGDPSLRNDQRDELLKKRNSILLGLQTLETSKK